MKKIVFAVLALVVLLAAIVLLAPGLVPAKAYKGRIETAASTSLGRAVTVGDDLSFTIFPHTAFRVSDLEIANAEGFDADYFARVGEAQIGVKLFPLFSGGVVVDRFVLIEPDIRLERAANGTVNWNLAQAENGADAPGDDTRGETSVRGLRLGDVRIEGGKAVYTDHEAGKSYAGEAIDLAVGLNSLYAPLEMDGELVFQGAPSTVDLVLTTPGKILDGEAANLKLEMTLGAASAGADLALGAGETVSYAGPVRLEAPDLPAFAALMGTPLEDAPGFDALSVSGDIDGGATGLRLDNAEIAFDKIDAQGGLSFDWAGARPKATGALGVGTLDLRPYLPPPTESADGFPAWSEEKLDFSSLRNIDAEFDIAAETIFLNDLKVGESRMKLTILNGRMTAEIPALAMYGGQGSGRLVVNARERTPSFSGVFDMSAVDAEPFSIDMLKTDRLLGLGSFKFDFTASGASQAAIMRSLDGTGGFDVANGALKGVNLLKLARAAASLEGGLNPAALASAVATVQGPNEETDFTEFLSNFAIDNGLVNAPKITLNGPFLAMNGSGSVNLPEQSLDLRLAPRATTAASGEGGRTITLPLRITGTFSQPKIALDVEALARGRAETEVRGLLKGVLGEEQRRRPAEDEASEPEANVAPAEPIEETIAKEALGRLFGKPKTEEPAEDEPAEDEPQ
ncbi:MAG: AsmA family protein [Parvularculaceae bacterium]